VVSVVFAVSVPALRQSAMQLETSPKQ
jgi:HPt (histidine-containing phosphotransfer) domain-containing protein